MNQILDTKAYNNKKKIKHKLFKLQLYSSMFAITIAIIVVFAYLKELSQKENISNSLIKNYNIYKLYSSSSSYNNYQKHNYVANSDNTIFGIIEIPSINIYYPIFSNINEELLKISPCKFFGESPNQNGNICIAGHNYNNSMFFSNIYRLNINDKIYIFDNTGKKYVYNINNIYEVNESDLSPILDYEKNEKILTLITCNNINFNRIIVRAKQY